MRLSEKWSQCHHLCKPESTIHQRSKSQVFAYHVHQTLDVCLSLGQGCHLLTLLATHTGVSHSSVLSLWQLYNSIPSSEFEALVFWTQILSFKASCLSGASALCSVWLVSGQLSDSSVDLGQGILLMLLPECKVVRDLTWPWRLRSSLCPLKGSSCGSTNMLGRGELRQTCVIQILTLWPVFISTYRTIFSVNRSVVVKDTWILNDWV